MAVFTSLLNENIERGKNRTSKVVEVSNFQELFFDLQKDIDSYQEHHNVEKTKYLGYYFLNIKVNGNCPKRNGLTGGHDSCNDMLILRDMTARYFRDCGIRFGLDLSEAKIEEYVENCFAVEPMPEYLIMPAGDDERASVAGVYPNQRPYFMAFSDQINCDGEWVYSDQKDGIAIRYVGPSKKVVVPKRFTHRMDGIFDICDWVEEAVFPSHLASTSVPNGCFRKMTNLKKLKFENGVTDIGNRAAYNLSNLEEVEFPDTLTSIGEECFMNCSNLRSVKLPKNLSHLDKKVFANCVNLRSADFPKEMPLTEINAETFFNCTSLKEIVLPDSVTFIGDYAFENCVSLERFIAPNGRFSLNRSALTNCKNLKEIICSSTSVNDLYQWNIPNMPLSNLNNLFSKEENGKRRISHGALTCSIEELENFVLDEIKLFNLKLTGVLDDSAFEKLRNWVKGQVIDAWVFDFSECEFISSIPQNYMSYEANGIQVFCVIFPPKGKDYCAENSFDTEMAQIYYSDEVQRKGFWITDKTGSKGIKYTTSSNHIAEMNHFITSIEKDAFIVKNLCLKGKKRNASIINSIRIPKGVEIIQKECFYYVTRVTIVYINYGTKEIQDRAFAECKKLETITIPSTVEKIGADIFKDCPALKKITATPKIWEIIKKTGGIAQDVLSNIEFSEYVAPKESNETDYRLHFEAEDFYYKFDVKEFDASKIKNFDHLETMIISLTGKITIAFLEKLDQCVSGFNSHLILDLSGASYGSHVDEATIKNQIKQCVEVVEPGNFGEAEGLMSRVYNTCYEKDPALFWKNQRKK